ncbi:hypothetical protein NBM05_14930 [Rothia sp. AR01]|uniref:Uncharacterized protein n=1 Tax=Rothia santali TaxID=2949643 RepID=A0A9X2HH58_9MICC|nr:hypothetical protein [Rothia santali]MCP3427264.1 hypothetical protein [Rothia santali]
MRTSHSRPVVDIQPGHENDPRARTNLNLAYIALAWIGSGMMVIGNDPVRELFTGLF